MAVIALLMLGAASCNGGKKCCENASCEGKDVSEAAPEKKEKVVVARVSVKPEKEADFINVASQLVEKTRQEPGNLFYTLYQSPESKSDFIFYEIYEDEDAFLKHASSDYFAAFSEGIKDLIASDLVVEEY
jgi:quinol monooxygenase YgiN